MLVFSMSYNGYRVRTCGLVSATDYSPIEGYSAVNEGFPYQTDKQKIVKKTPKQLTVLKCNSWITQVINMSKFSLEDSFFVKSNAIFAREFSLLSGFASSAGLLAKSFIPTGKKSLAILLCLLWDLLMVTVHLRQSLRSPFCLTQLFAA